MAITRLVLALVACVWAALSSQVQAAGEAPPQFDVRAHLRDTAFSVPNTGVQISYVEGRIKVSDSSGEYTVTEWVNADGQLEFVGGSPADEIHQVFGTLDVMSNGMPRLEFNVEFGNGDIAAGAIVQGAVVTFMQSCDCTDGATFDCTTTMCTNKDKCKAGSKDKCKWSSYTID